jgi:hypothetical protein
VSPKLPLYEANHLLHYPFSRSLASGPYIPPGSFLHSMAVIVQVLEQVSPPQRKCPQIYIFLRMNLVVDAIRCHFPAHPQAFSPIRLYFLKKTVDLVTT